MIKTNGFYIATNRYLVVDTPVFDEIVDGIQLIQFFPQKDNQEGMVVIAEYGELEPHPLEIDVDELRDKIHLQMKGLSKEEKDDFFYLIEESKGCPNVYEAMNAIFNKKKEPQKFTNIYSGKYVIKDGKKVLIQPIQNQEYNSAEGEIKDNEISLLYHHENKDFISIFKFLAL